MNKQSCFAILSKEKARDGYMRAPAVLYRQWNREGLQIDRKTPLPDCGAANERPDTPVFCCSECGTAVMANISRDGTVYRIPANSLFFRREHRENHKCEACGASLWTALNPSAWGRQKAWAKIGDYGFVYRPLIDEHIRKAKSEALKEKLGDLSMTPGAVSAARGANRAFPLSSYIKRKYKGRIYGLIVDELHQYNNKSGQGDAMAELYDTAKKVVGMTATLINGYSSGIFYLLYRMVPSLMKKDGKDYETPTEFDKEYGVIQTTYEEVEPEYNSNRRTVQSRVSTRLLPGVSPLVYSRFLMEYAVFLSLTDMGKDLPDAILEHIGCHGPCEERSAFYRRRDKTSQFRRNAKFLELFHDYDREAARLWLEKTFPPQKHTEVLRDTGGSLFSSVIRMAKEAGEFGKAKAILDYILPCEHEESIREKVKLTAYEFDFQPCINYGCEGIFIDCYLMGKFDESGRSKLHVGTLKTLRRDAEAAKIMGELCGVLLHYENKYVNGNLHRYTPEKALELEYRRQLEQETKEEESNHA